MVFTYEAGRERDLRRYYQPWVDAQNLVGSADGNSKGLTYDGYQPRPSRDRALTAFAQLAALRLNARRAMVSLIDATRQYILAEATKTVSLIEPGGRQGDEGDEVWLGNAVISRHDAVCPLVFTSTYTAREEGEDGETYTSDCLVIPDCREDPRFADRDYVKGEPGVRFYAGVPITTKAGYAIGVYAISDEKPRAGLSAVEVRFMQDVAAAVMEHLELAKDSDDRMKGERMVRGLAEFIERSSLQSETPRRSKDATGSKRNKNATMERQTENARLTLKEDKEDVGKASQASPQPPTGDAAAAAAPGEAESPPNFEDKPAAQQRKRGESEREQRESNESRIFQRAARIIRQSTDADGVVFFDATAVTGIKGTNMREQSPSTSSNSDGGSFDSGASTTDIHTAADDTTATTRSKRRKVRVKGHSLREELQGDDARADETIFKACPVAGFSINKRSPKSVTEADFAFTKSVMERYIKRYPTGKFFDFDEEGIGINSSDEKSEKSETDQQLSQKETTESAAVERIKRKKRSRSERFTPTEFLKVVPNLRSLIFLPLWDPATERWVAGGFIWTTAAGRLMSPDNELPYLKAFGNSILTEVVRTNAQRADRAKTTFIASISHELRSPLHGILGSVEFLQDTVASSPYQKSLVSSIETCGRTLLDTIDHVLDYAKINKLRNATSTRRRYRHSAAATRALAHSRNASLPGGENSILGVTTDFNLAQLVEEVCDTVCAGSTFRKAHKLDTGAFHQDSESGANTPRRTPDPAGGDERARSSATANATAGKTEDRVAVTLNVTPFSDNWLVRSQPGALRRIVMNLLGNSLKYTDSGYITVSLVQLQAGPNADSVGFTLCVEDSGRGMSTEYQRTKLFAPFSQEDPFSNGTGLGLSIVKQIVESLKGEIDVQSTMHVGTKVKVALRLPAAAKGVTTWDTPLARLGSTRNSSHLETLKNKRVSLILPAESFGGGGQKIMESMVQACEGFGMETQIPERLELLSGAGHWPDFVITEPDSLGQLLQDQQAQAPALAVICLCTDPADKSALEMRISRQIATLGWVVDITAQPCGPFKLARLLSDAQDRLAQFLDQRALTRSTSSTDHDQKRPTMPSLDSSAILPSRSASDNVLTGSATATVDSSTDIPGTAVTPVRRSPPPVMPPSAIAFSTTTAESQAAMLSPQAIEHLSPASIHDPNYKPRVLLVDDNAINLKLLVVFAKRQKLEYAEATNGLEAFEKFQAGAWSAASASSAPTNTSSSSISSSAPGASSSSSSSVLSPPTSSASDTLSSISSPKPSKHFDFVLMDISMPVMDGLESTRRIRQFETEHGLSRAIIVALTGLASARDQQDAVVAGVDMYLIKPVKFTDIQRLFKLG
ncbi:hypothetical protein BX600DRAFT_488572 [Xylariales sp. PMI_506]|nr:hypothetical protein BX600DRAFT_488572 [Xylariales sp. PMI_506]